MTIVSNTGPLIMLAKIDRLELLRQMFSAVAIPPAVERELMAKSGADVTRLDAALAEFVEVLPLPDLPPTVKVVTRHLEEGERQAIALAHAQTAILIIDERLGRQAARQLGLTVTGSAGILIEAKKRGHIAAVRPLLQRARQHGYWLSDALLGSATRMAGENE